MASNISCLSEINVALLLSLRVSKRHLYEEIVEFPWKTAHRRSAVAVEIS